MACFRPSIDSYVTCRTPKQPPGPRPSIGRTVRSSGFRDLGRPPRVRRDPFFIPSKAATSRRTKSPLVSPLRDIKLTHARPPASPQPPDLPCQLDLSSAPTFIPFLRSLQTTCADCDPQPVSIPLLNHRREGPQTPSNPETDPNAPPKHPAGGSKILQPATGSLCRDLCMKTPGNATFRNTAGGSMTYRTQKQPPSPDLV